MKGIQPMTTVITELQFKAVLPNLMLSYDFAGSHNFRISEFISKVAS